MLDIIDATNTTDCVLPELPSATLESQNELGEEITNLWVAHANAKMAARATNVELRAIRAKLGEQLCRMKEVLAQPGRGGQWSGFLRNSKIPRATADRLVARHLQSLSPDAKCLDDAVSELTEEEIVRLFHSMRPKLRRTLTTPQSLYCFIDVLTAASFDGTCRRVTDEGILVLKVAQQTTSAEPSAGEPAAESQAVLAQPAAGLDQELM
jgi:hypothetical protein